MTDLGLWIIIGAFVAWELDSYFTGNHKTHTLSNRIRHFELEHPWSRWLVAALCLLLALHLVFNIPHR